MIPLTETQKIGLKFMEEAMNAATERRNKFLIECLKELGQDIEKQWKFDVKTQSFTEDNGNNNQS